MTEESCPLCEGTQIMHRWRCDMATLRWIDNYTCLACGHRWQVQGRPEFVDEGTRDVAG